MDPLSLAASVAGVVSLTIQVSGTIVSYCKAVKDAPKSAHEVALELSLLLTVLQQLDTFLKSQPMKNNSFDQSSVLATALVFCRDAIEGIASKLPTPKGTGKSHALERLKWPFTEKEVQKRLEALQRCASTFQFALTIEGCSLLSQTSQDAISSLKLELCTASKVLELTKNVGTLSASATEASRVSTQVAEILELISTFRGTAGVIQSLSENVEALALESQEAKEQQILNWLSSVNYSHQHRAIRAKRLPGTGQWLLDCKRFQGWFDKASPVLWCTGGPGAGKTVLASLVIDHILHKASSADQAIAYFYFDYREQETQTPPAMIASLVRQLAVQRSVFPQSLVEFYETFKQDQAQGSVPDLSNVLNQLCLSYGKCFIVIDALDECKASYRKKVLLLLNGLDLGTVRLFVTSRPHSHDIKQHFVATEQIQVEASEWDIKAYCHRMMDDNETTRELVEGSLRQDVAKSISKNAQGMFLLPVLQMQVILEAMTRSEIRRSLGNLSANLSQAFEDTLRRINDEPRNRQNVALQSLMWISHARSALRIEELCHALATRVGDTELDRDDLLHPRFIVECCLGLVVIDDESSVIRLVHHTLQDFLQTRQQHLFPNATTQITNVCLTYLCLGDREDDVVAQEDEDFAKEPLEREWLHDLPFLGYASASWGHHAQHAASDEIEQLALRFLMNSSMILRADQSQLQYLSLRPDLLWQCEVRPNSHRTGLTGLHVAACFGLAGLANLLLVGGLDVNARDSHWNTALHEAARYGHLETTKLLLSRGAKFKASNVDGATPLDFAVSFGYKEVLLELLKYGADPNARFGDYWTPLHSAADKGYLEILKILLDHDASIKSHSVRGLIALHRAAGRGHLEIIKVLLEQGSPINAETVDNWTPLHGASSSGQHEAVRLLLEHGAKIDHQSTDGRTALHRACRGGHYLTVAVLLEKGANILVPDMDGNIVLHRAAKGGHKRIGRLLLDKEPSTRLAQLSAISASGRTPRGEASYSGHWEMAALLREEEIQYNGPHTARRSDLEIAIEEGDLGRVKGLLARGAVINEWNSDGITALHQALLLGHGSIAEVLIQKNADLKAVTADGWQPLHCAAKEGSESSVRLCLRNGADITARTNDGQTPLHKACKSGSVATTQLLLDEGAHVQKSDRWGWRPLHTASAAGFGDIVELLIANGADLEARDKEGRTAHACAARAGHHSLVEYLRMGRLRPDISGAHVSRVRRSS